MPEQPRVPHDWVDVPGQPARCARCGSYEPPHEIATAYCNLAFSEPETPPLSVEQARALGDHQYEAPDGGWWYVPAEVEAAIRAGATREAEAERDQALATNALLAKLLDGNIRWIHTGWHQVSGAPYVAFEACTYPQCINARRALTRTSASDKAEHLYELIGRTQTALQRAAKNYHDVWHMAVPEPVLDWRVCPSTECQDAARHALTLPAIEPARKDGE